jgi:hypothetical protein
MLGKEVKSNWISALTGFAPEFFPATFRLVAVPKFDVVALESI